ncbi:MAG TPA: ABC-type transport auxiliary lipoprotein family protein [Rhodanobacteraceae bacterium]|jgi:cholesterol transport system auxiliary component|nr:ABC-type transport auxiliary lipoprotein family protein [Rhodanobacteraceae bacterium]
MTRTLLALCACTLALGGCVHATRVQFPQHYALGGPAQTLHEHRGAGKSGEAILQIARIAAPEWLEGTAMYYRLDYQHDNRLSAYGRSDWIAPPASLLEPLVQSAIAAGGGWRAVLGPGNPANADTSLQLRLDDFSQRFSQPDRSAGVLDATATLVDHHGDRVVAQKHFHIEVAASTPDAQGGAQALGNASRQFVAQVQQWLESAANAKQPEEGENR